MDPPETSVQAGQVFLLNGYLQSLSVGTFYSQHAMKELDLGHSMKPRETCIPGTLAIDSCVGIRIITRVGFSLG